MTAFENATKFFTACEAPEGWAGCKAYVAEGATFTAQSEPLAEIKTVAAYCDWMYGLATFFNYPTEIRRLIYTTNAIEGYNRGLRKVVKTKSSFPTSEAARKLLYLTNQNITKKWSMPIQNWAHILNQLAIRFEERFTFG